MTGGSAFTRRQLIRLASGVGAATVLGAAVACTDRSDQGVSRAGSTVGSSATVDPSAFLGSDGMPLTWQQMGLMEGFQPAQDKRVTKANWQNGPFNRWSFQHMQELFPTMTVSRGDGPVSPLKSRPQDLGRLPFGDGRTVEQALQAAYADAIVVLHNGDLVWEKYWNGMTSDTRHLLMSVTKSFTGTLGGILIDRGELDPDKTMGYYVPELKDSGFGPATVRQAMDMEVDIDWDEKPEAVADPNSPFNRYLSAIGFTATADTSGAYEFLPTIPAIGEPGRAFHYVSPTTDAFGWLLEKVTNMPYGELLSREIYSKLGAERDGLVILGADRKALSTGGLNLTARDLARFGQMMLQNGNINGKQIVPQSFIDDIQRNGDRAKYAAGHTTERPTSNYRSYWWVNQIDDHSYGGNGIHGQQVWISPPTKTVIVRFSSYPVTGGPELNNAALKGFDIIAKALST